MQISMTISTVNAFFIQHSPFWVFVGKNSQCNEHKDFHAIRYIQRDSLRATNSQLNEFKASAINDKKLSTKCRGEPSKKYKRGFKTQNLFFFVVDPFSALPQSTNICETENVYPPKATV